MRNLSVDSGGVRIAVRDFGGEGPALVLLHGLTGTFLDWTLMAPLLTAQHHVVALDLRGHGDSGDGDWSWADALADVAAVAEVVGDDNPAGCWPRCGARPIPAVRGSSTSTAMGE